MTRAEAVIGFIEKYCRIPSGDKVGKPLVLEEFQKRFIRDIYDNPYQTRRAYLSLARKNGKTALIAAILLAHIAGPEAKQNTQIVSGAQSRDQAALLFELAEQMVNLNPTLQKKVRIVPSGKRLIGLSKNVQYKALSAEGKTAHGLSPVLAILDEVGQVEGPRDKFISAITTAQGAYEHPLLIAISTQAPTDHDLFSVWLDTQETSPDPRIVSHVYSAPENCDLDDRKAWAAANPAMGIFKAVSDLEMESRNALTMPANEPEFRQLSLNQRVESSNPFMTKAVWERNSAPPTPFQGRSVYGGLDLSAVHDLCAALLLDAEDFSINPFFWLPKEGLEQKAKHDHVPWDMWEKQGFLNTTPGRAIQYEYVAEFLRGIFDSCNVVAFGFDRALMRFLRPWLVKANFSDDELKKFIEFGQGTLSMTPALRELEVKAVNGQLRHGNHPIMNMCSRNAVVVGQSGARKLDKEKARGRIDGMTALANAFGVMPSEADKPSEPSLSFV
jgi:phage terminase large subunit-like protein